MAKTNIDVLDDLNLLSWDVLAYGRQRGWVTTLVYNSLGASDENDYGRGWYLNLALRIVEDSTLGTIRLTNGLGLRWNYVTKDNSTGYYMPSVEYALDIGIHDADSIRVILEHLREAPVGLFSLDGRPHLKTVAVTATNVSAYQTLLTEGVQ